MQFNCLNNFKFIYLNKLKKKELKAKSTETIE